MKQVVLFCSFLSLCTQVSLAQYSLSPRVGEVIDQNEREYFGLFPTIEGFVSAKAVVRKDRSVEFVISRATSGVHSDTSFSISSTVAENLVLYLEDFESYRYVEKEMNWDLLDGLAISAPAIESKLNDEVSVMVQTPDGGQLNGKLLYVGDSSLILLQGLGQYNWLTVSLFERSVHYSNIDHITIERDGYFGSGLGWGALIGGVAGIPFIIGGANTSNSTAGPVSTGYYLIGFSLPVAFGLIGGAVGAVEGIDIHSEVQGSYSNYQESLSLLREHVMFTSFPPPEIQRLRDSVTTTLEKNVAFETSEYKQSQNLASPNLVYLELAGNGGLFSVNYERRFLENFFARIGVGVYSGISVPILAYYFINLGRGNIQLGAGVTLASEKQFAYPTASIGYRYQSRYSRFMFELALTPMFLEEIFFSVGIGGGYTF